MTIDKATEVIEDILNGKRSARATSGIVALKLGIEALKLVQSWRLTAWVELSRLMAGETD